MFSTAEEVEETRLLSNTEVVGPVVEKVEVGSTSNTGESCAGIGVGTGCLSNTGVLRAGSEVTEEIEELGVEVEVDVDVEGVSTGVEAEDGLETDTSRGGNDGTAEEGWNARDEVELMAVIEEGVALS